MRYQIISYLKFLQRSTRQHGVHSPFVYDLLVNCFYDTKQHSEYQLLDSFRNTLYSDDEVITVTDFGAGSRVFTSELRRVGSMARRAGIRKSRQRLLWRLSKYFRPASILELGTSLGLSTVALATGYPGAMVTTLEGCGNTAEKARSYFGTYDLENIRLLQLEFDEFLVADHSAYDLIFIDGNHDKEKTLYYFELLKKNAKNDTVIIFDDIYWSKAMTEAWMQIIADDSVRVSIDTFFWGMVFFRKEQEKQHFRIRL